jgi:hypothetical protein
MTTAALADWSTPQPFSLPDLEFLVRRAGLRIRESRGRRSGHYAVIVAEK